MDSAEAVRLRSAYKYYGKGKNKKVILDQLNMTVRKGSIYGLLGASGCGKSTILSCIVGCKALNSGELWVLGGKPGTKGSGVPGPRIGYMPQDIALVGEFTVRGTIFYFGRIFGMEDEVLERRYHYLSDLLDLPPSDRYVENLSGGQQRRVSFAAAMVHEPELLILDEPTVGLDPVLREKIWTFLVEVTSKTPLSVIITTHYIEEAKNANQIGLMRSGILLAEESPANIMRMVNTTSLEEAFLTLSKKQGDVDVEHPTTSLGRIQIQPFDKKDKVEKIEKVVVTKEAVQEALNNIYSKSAISVDQLTSSKDELSPYHEKPKTSGCLNRYSLTTRGHLKALMTKNIMQFFRQPAALMIALIFPIAQICAFFVAVGHDVQDLQFAVVNDEVPDFLQTCRNMSLVTTKYYESDGECSYHSISCRFLNAINESFAEQIAYADKETALEAMRKGEISATLYFKSNFSDAYLERRKVGRFVEVWDIDASEIQTWVDKSDYQLSMSIKRHLLDAYKEFSENLLTSCHEFPKLGNLPMKFMTPVYGTFDEPYTYFVASGIFTTVIFFLSTIVTSTIMISDRLDGVWDRTLVAGVNPSEILFTHVVVQGVVMAVQTLEILIMFTFVFELPNRGSLGAIAAMLMLEGFAGMCYGFLISIFCTSHSMANYIATGSFYPMIILCGILWPLEGMPKVLRWIALALPFTVPTMSMRNIMAKGWTVTHYHVADGYAVILAWIVIFSILCLMGLRKA